MSQEPKSPYALYAYRIGYLAAMMGLDRVANNPYQDAGQERHGIVWHTEAAQHWDHGYDTYRSIRYVIQSGDGYLKVYNNACQLMTPDPLEAVKLGRDEAIQLAHRMREAGWEAELIPICLARFTPAACVTLQGQYT